MAIAPPIAPEPHHLRWLIRRQSPLRRRSVQFVLLSRILSSAGATMLLYGAMVHVARSGGSQIDVSLLSAAGALAALTFGLRGGAVADSLPKRIALSASYALQAILCVLIPRFVGSEVGPLVALLFLIGLLVQITTPAIKVASTLVSTSEDLAVMTVYLNASSGVGSAIGTAALAPMLLRFWDIDAVVYAAGIIFALASVRSFGIPRDKGIRRRRDDESVSTTRPSLLHFRTTAVWLLNRRTVSIMILAGAGVSILSSIFDSLQPIYVKDVLDADPANSIYIFAPGAIGAILGALAAVVLIRWRGERWLAIISLVFFSIAMVLFGVIKQVAPSLAPLSPLRILERYGQNLDDMILAAGMIAILVEFAQAAASTCVQGYIQRRVPYEEQGSTFGFQSFLSNGLGVTGTLTIGSLAMVFGTQAIFLIAPPVVAAALIALIRSTYRAAEIPPPHRGELLREFWDETADEVSGGSEMPAGPQGSG